MSNRCPEYYQRWLDKIKNDQYLLKNVPKDVPRTEELCLAAVQGDGFALEFVPEELKTEAVCRTAIGKRGIAIKYVPNQLLTESMYLAAIDNYAGVLKVTPVEFITEAICLAAVHENAFVLEHVPKEKITTEMCIVAVSQNGWALEFAKLPADGLLVHPEQLAAWNAVLAHTANTDEEGQSNVIEALLEPLEKQMKATLRISPQVQDEIQVLIDHVERLQLDMTPIKETLIEKMTVKKPSKHHPSTMPTL